MPVIAWVLLGLGALYVFSRRRVTVVTSAPRAVPTAGGIAVAPSPTTVVAPSPQAQITSGVSQSLAALLQPGGPNVMQALGGAATALGGAGVKDASSYYSALGGVSAGANSLLDEPSSGGDEDFSFGGLGADVGGDIGYGGGDGYI